MEWMEIIKVQAIGNEASIACKDYLEKFRHIRGESGPVKIRLYHNAVIDGLHIVILDWNTNHPEKLGSHLSQPMIHELKQLGIVDHSVWSTDSL